MFVPEPVISLSIKPKGKENANFSKALNRFQREDPTFRVHIDNESKETIISGMGELHLEIYVERMRREYNVECITGKPEVAYRERLSENATFDNTLKKQTGGAGQFAKIQGFLTTADGNNFESRVVGGTIPEKFLAACEKGFREALEKGPLTGHPVLNTHMVIEDGATHAVDSNELAFRTCAMQAFKEGFLKAKPEVLEPVMNVSVTAPIEFHGAVVGMMNKRSAMIADTETAADDFTISAECSLNSMFGFATQLRASTQGKGEFTLEFKDYAPAPPQLQRELIAEYAKKSKK